jgi:hypothetical protein
MTSRESPRQVQTLADVLWSPKITSLQLSAFALFLEIGSEIALTFATAAILKQQGFSLGVYQELSLYFARPRPAPLIGLLGAVHERWADEGLHAMIADGVLSYLTASLGCLPITLYGLKASNPAKPPKLKLALIGAIIISIPSFVVWSVVGLITSILGLVTCNAFLAVIVLLVALFLVSLPFIALFELIIRIWRLFFRSGFEKILALSVTRSRSWLRLYYVFLFCSLLINIGNCIAFSEVIVLLGDLYCPGDLAKVTAVWWVFPFLTHFILGLYNFLLDSSRPP